MGGSEVGISSCGVGGVLLLKFDIVGIGGGFIVLSRFNLRASVGLMVLAPSPEARPDAKDCRRLPDDDGVCSPFCVFFDDGFGAADVGVKAGSFCSRGAGCRLFTLFWRDCVVAVRVDVRDSSAPGRVEGAMVVRLLPLVRLLLRISDGFRPLSEAREADGSCCELLFFTILVIMPGPMLFLGCLAAADGCSVFVDVEIELCRRDRSESSLDGYAVVVEGGCVVDACLPPTANRCLKLGVRLSSSLGR